MRSAMRRPSGDRGRRPGILGEAVDHLEYLPQPRQIITAPVMDARQLAGLLIDQLPGAAGRFQCV
jgi:hypothetical protein